jgi:hypothetical protein
MIPWCISHDRALDQFGVCPVCAARNIREAGIRATLKRIDHDIKTQCSS